MVGTLEVGGVQNVVMNLYRSIDKEKFEFHFGVLGNKTNKLEEEVVNLGGKVHHLPEINKDYKMYIKNLKEILLTHGPFNIMHSHMHLNNGFVMLAAKSVGIPVRISHSHSIKRRDKDTSAKLVIYEKVMKEMIWKLSTTYIGCNNATGEYMFGNKRFKKKGIILTNSIDLTSFSFSINNRNQTRDSLDVKEKLVLTNIGTFRRVKNQSFILKVLKELLDRGVAASLLLIGDGEDRLILEELSKKLKVENNTLFLGNRKDISSLLSASDIFIFPSLNEGLPLSVIEAQANGLPCLISNQIPPDVVVNKNVIMAGLDESVSKWADYALELINKRHTEINCNLYFNGFDVSDLGQRIELIYNKELK